MKKTPFGTALMALIMASATAAHAQDAAFTWEGSVEVGVGGTVRADDPAAEITDGYLSIEVEFEAALSERLSVFGGLTLETLSDAVDDRPFEDRGGAQSGFGAKHNMQDLSTCTA